jgi:hypothetical protein
MSELWTRELSLDCDFDVRCDGPFSTWVPQLSKEKGEILVGTADSESLEMGVADGEKHVSHVEGRDPPQENPMYPWGYGLFFSFKYF